MRIDIITIFPKMFAPVLNESIIKRAKNKGKVKIYIHNLRGYTLDKHKKVDDRPFGGGPGMVICPEPIFRAVEAVKSQLPATIIGGCANVCGANNFGGKSPRHKNRRVRQKFWRNKSKVILLSPQGETLTQKAAERLSKYKHIILICGHYEGIDERVRQHLADEEISIGDYVLTGGELAAMVLTDAIVRLIPGVLGDKNSLNFESFEGNLLEYSQYTRPADFRGMKVPAILLSGNHKKIAEWRKEEAVKRTKKARPDLLTRT